MSTARHPYPLDLDTVPLGAIVVAVDCWGEQPIALRVVERSTHQIVGRTAAGRTLYVGGPLVRRMATDDEAAAFAPRSAPLPTVKTAPPPRPTKQMELF